MTAAVAASSLAAAPVASAAASSGWTLDSFAQPTNFSASDNAGCGSYEARSCDRYVVTATDAGSQSTDGSDARLTDTLPPGLPVQSVSFVWSGSGAAAAGLAGQNLAPSGFCTTTAQEVQCDLPTAADGFPPVAPNDTLQMTIYVTVASGVSGSITNSASVSGGGAPSVSTSEQNQISSAAPAFGASSFSSYTAGADGAPDTQAGDHPYELTTRIDLANAMFDSPLPEPNSVQDPKDVVVDLPLGFLGSALSAPTCTPVLLSSAAGCPADSVVGHILTDPISSTNVNSPIYNVVPEYGVAAEFGYIDETHGSHVLYASVVPTPAGYVLQTTSHDIPQVQLTDIVVTFYGNPAAQDGTGNTPAAMFTNPSLCSGQPLVTTVHMDSWQDPGTVNADGTPNLSDPKWVSASSSAPPVTGCDQLQFNPMISVQPDTTVADSPSGLDVDIKVPQNEDPGTLATPPVRDASVTLPGGFTVDPSSADGLGACSPAQIDLGSAAPPSCPENSKIGTVELTTPLLPGTLMGSIYLATQDDNPFDSLLAGYIVVDDPTTGVVIKIPGNLTPNPQTGQITAVFDNNPQFPFSELKLSFKGGSRGVLATPESCGTFMAGADLSPWSAPDSGPDAAPSDSLSVNIGCVSGFSPTFIAGTQNTQAGAFSPFVLSFSRSDTDQELSGLSVTLPPGLLAKLAGVAECSNADVAAAAESSGTAEQASPSCPGESQVGTVEAGAGPGPDPLFLPGKVYLTGPYKSAPFGLAVVVPAVAGPYDLGTVVVREALYINPTTAQVTAVSDPFPTMLDGIPLRLRRVDATFNRPNFTVNPTSCNPMSVAGTLTSAQGMSAPVSSPFQAANCASLPFKPSFSVSTQHNGELKGHGASLKATVTFPHAGPQSGSQSGEANIRYVRVTLPKSLPARLTTLQKACTEQQFAANPAGCPPASFVGAAVAHTPVLANPLVGPAILVSHGGAAFPDLVVILQGEGITIDLTGNTGIKDNITTSTFASVPDAPISSFELTLPEGEHSALAADGNLCQQQLVMPTEFVGRNGAQIKQSTPIEVEGCSNILSFISHKIKKRTLSVSVSVPAAGKLTATGKGLSNTSKTAKGREAVKLTLHQLKAGKLKTKVEVVFTPSTGKDRKKLSKSLSLTFKK